jgi:flavin-dependent dehydrogenase
VVRTNPLYGRGCSFAAVSAHLLLDALESSADPGQRLLRYRADIERELRPYYDVMRQADRSAIKRAKAALLPEARPSLRGKIVKSFMEDGIAIAMRTDLDLMRAFLKGFHMLEHPQAWMKRPKNLLKIVRVWARGKAKNADLYAPKPGPDRRPMFDALGLDAAADEQRVRQAA